MKSCKAPKSSKMGYFKASLGIALQAIDKPLAMNVLSELAQERIIRETISCSKSVI